MFLDDHICGPAPGSILGKVDELPEHGGKAIDFKNDQGHRLSIFIQRMEGTIEVYQNRCPHAGTPLNLLNERFMDIENRHLICRTHGAKFDFDTGKCVMGPCKGQFLRKIAFEIQHGGLIVSQ